MGQLICPQLILIDGEIYRQLARTPEIGRYN
jgi:hypothetical protein